VACGYHPIGVYSKGALFMESVARCRRDSTSRDTRTFSPPKMQTQEQITEVDAKMGLVWDYPVVYNTHLVYKYLRDMSGRYILAALG